LAYEWADEAWILVDGHVAARGPMNRILRDRATLQQAHLKIPLLLDIGLAMREAFPEVAGQSLPTTREALLGMIRELRASPAPAQYPRVGRLGLGESLAASTPGVLGDIAQAFARG
jgi:hypothetical protein